MKITAIILIIAMLFPLLGCDALSLEDPKTVKLEERLAALENKYNDLVTVNRALILENGELQLRLTAAQTTMRAQDNKITELEFGRPETVMRSSQTHVIKFANNQLYNKPDSKAVAKKVLAFARGHKGKVKITIEGYSSKAGATKLNKLLSKERAEGVMHKIYEAHNSNNPLDIEVITHGETDDDQRMVVVRVTTLP